MWGCVYSDMGIKGGKWEGSSGREWGVDVDGERRESDDK